MIRYESGVLMPWYRKYGYRILALCWLLGLVCGALLFLQAGSSVLSLMRRVVWNPVSISGLLSNLLIPFLFTVYAVYTSVLWLIFPVCIMEATLHSFCLAGLYQAFSSAGWLVCGLVLFHSSVCAFAAFLVWSRIYSGGKIRGWLCWWIFVCAVVYVLDYYVISPFLASLIIH